jgi:hypothetical protein
MFLPPPTLVNHIWKTPEPHMDQHQHARRTGYSRKRMLTRSKLTHTKLTAGEQMHHTPHKVWDASSRIRLGHMLRASALLLIRKPDTRNAQKPQAPHTCRTAGCDTPMHASQHTHQHAAGTAPLQPARTVTHTSGRCRDSALAACAHPSTHPNTLQGQRPCSLHAPPHTPQHTARTASLQHVPPLHPFTHIQAYCRPCGSW